MLKRYLPAGLVFAVTAGIYIATLPKGLLPGDSGELIAASRTLSIAHPPGYPLYTMVGKLLSSALGFGSIAYRYNLISALIASLTLAVVYLIMRDLGVRRSLAVVASLALGTLGSFWLQATTAEVYAFNGLFTALLLYIAIGGRKYGERGFLLLAFIGGLALAHHLTLVYPLVSALVIMLITWPVRPGVRTIVAAVGLLILGMSIWLYIPVRANLSPPLVWGRTDTVSGFLDHITAQGYRWRLRAFDLPARASNFMDSLGLVAREAGWVLPAAALVGLPAVRKRLVPRLALAGLVALFGVHFAMYNIPDIESHLFPALIAVALLAAIGLERVVSLVERRGRGAAYLAVAACFLMLIPNLATIHPRADQWFAGDYAHAIEQSARDACGEDCIVVTSGHISTFPLLYAALVEPGGVKVYDIAASNPAIIGARARTPGIEECVSKAADRYGLGKVAMLGPVPALVLGREPLICGMVYVAEEPQVPCRSPETYPIRGVGTDLREYSSRLLSGSYYLHLAEWHGQQGDTADVRGYVDRALLAAADDEATHINGAQVYLKYGMVDRAFDAARKAVAINPEFFGGHDLLGGMLLRAGKTDLAITEYRLALKGNPSPGAVHSNLANAYLSRGDNAAALENFSRALEYDSTLVNAYVGMGLALEKTGDKDRALACFRKARSVDPYPAPAYHAEAALELAEGRHDRALEVAREGLARSPGSALLLSDAGLAYLRSDRLDSAVVCLREAVKQDSLLLNARGNLAVALERKGLQKQALEQYKVYLRTAPPGRAREIAARAIERLTAE